MRRLLALLAIPLALAGCPKPEDPCTPANQKATARDLLRSYYLYPDLLQAIDPSDPNHPTLSDYLDASTATARAQGLDRYWTYATTVTVTQQYFDEGTSLGFGVGILMRQDASLVYHLFVSQVFPSSAASDAGFARGDEILAIGDTPTALVDVPTLVSGATSTDDALGRVSSAFGPTTAGVTRSFQVMPVGATASVLRTATKRTYSLDPVPQGPVLISQGTGVPVGYVALRTFITPAEPLLTNVFGQLRAAGVQDVIVDLRYNGGGRISTAGVLTNLLGGARAPGDVAFRILYNTFHTASDETATFAPAAQSVTPLRIAFITTGASASASELVANAMEGWMHTDVALVGARTYGKPVGQLPFQLGSCDAVIAVIGFRIVNVEGDGNYYDGLPDAAGNFSGPLCQAADDLAHAQGDAAEASTAAALQWLATGTCPPPPAQATSAKIPLRAARALDAYPEARAPDEAQRNVRGLF